MAKKFELAVFIGRFRPYHIAHHKIVMAALESAERVLVLVGSSGAPRTHRNPWTFPEVQSMIMDSLADEPAGWSGRIIVRPMIDLPYNDEQWVANVHNVVAAACAEFGITKPRIGLIGHKKPDGTGFYLDLFPKWGSIPVENHQELNATQMREAIFSTAALAWLEHCDGSDGRYPAYVTPAVRRQLLQFTSSPPYWLVSQEYEWAREEWMKWGNTPFPSQFQTVDAMVVQSGHVLLIKRKDFPGKGLWALPGGFVHHNERKFDAAIRELYEETSIDVDPDLMRKSMIAKDDFDDPYRSSRGRVHTMCYLFHLDPGKLPRVRAGDDAADARWVPLAEVAPDRLFEDHFGLVKRMETYLP